MGSKEKLELQSKLFYARCIVYDILSLYTGRHGKPARNLRTGPHSTLIGCHLSHDVGLCLRIGFNTWFMLVLHFPFVFSKKEELRITTFEKSC
ncbi:unnamed protein product [Sphenostylis stenocarpa]|uniref:Uncharacterized protein n=1 Tax=Sphenostylis stenocarpa TaxID=92480 RepID=A0AA86RZY9_9FABA|nr:unnamed protein product [Sphenostylis stenocarpa]